jgi:hypothetical protein
MFIHTTSIQSYQEPQKGHIDLQCARNQLANHFYNIFLWNLYLDGVQLQHMIKVLCAVPILPRYTKNPALQ